ncbi:DUF2057 domain-containing protein [Agarivorans sp. TSD2052]|uniref:YccT family protein n=1 Tax=Agarivorans sp. TSD2052 TaxID=2937286 RepID=UPI00200E9C0B|nr:DUF2057 domain-containing protein [Agarivorans sp. TSD2052]UPW16920.1 DUF2057 domain-containing protein [Agarivorans sp. TSD2052]
MRFLVKVLSLSLVFLASWSAYAASFSTPSHFEIMYVDKQSTGAFSKTKAKLDTGSHQVVVRYSDNVGSSNNSEIIKSTPIVINLDIKQGQDIVLKAKQETSINRAKKYAAKPTFTLSDKNGSKVNESHYLLPMKPGVQFSRDYLEEIAEIEATQAGNAPAVAATAAVAASTTPKAETAVTSSTNTAAVAATAVVASDSVEPPVSDSEMMVPAGDNTELQMLQFWYQRADAATRKQFQIWVIQQQ